MVDCMTYIPSTPANNGRQSITTNTTLTSSSPKYIGVNTVGATTNITLPAANVVAEGFIFVINDEIGVAGSFTITITRAGSDTIEGSTTKTITTNLGSLRIYSNGVDQWFLI
jgi:hypothetical protein